MHSLRSYIADPIPQEQFKYHRGGDREGQLTTPKSIVATSRGTAEGSETPKVVTTVNPEVVATVEDAPATTQQEANTGRTWKNLFQDPNGRLFEQSAEYAWIPNMVMNVSTWGHKCAPKVIQQNAPKHGDEGKKQSLK
ncbi:hypothetical protein HAX54_021715 [Datura stramonium]|uniref:Uncharacterized protein n=1 Tax=Datura stramonium TaxID=4076 RepID=A0ABS8UVL0_DATST|nr:hypothetical protein [Datura stramonium]